MPSGSPTANPIEPLSSALVALKEVTGLSVAVRASHASKNTGMLTVKSPDGRVLELAYEVKATIDRHDQLATFKQQAHRAVLVTRALSSAMLEQCRQRNIEFLDASGNCFLNQPGFFVFVSGRKGTTLTDATARGLTPAALRLVFAALCKPAILQGSVRNIAEIAGVSHGAAGIALATLEEMDMIGKAPSGQRMLVHPERWLDVWTEGYLGRLRPKLTTYRMSAATALSSLLEQVSPVTQELLLGGEAAAKHAQLGLKPGALTLYIDVQNEHVMRNLVRELKLRRDPDGPVELVEIFWNTQALPSFPAVPDALVYADLIGSGIDRTLDIAAKLKKRIIDDVARQT